MTELKPWRVLRQEPIYSDPPHLELTGHTVELPDGTIVEKYYRISSRPSCAVVARDHDGNYVMLRQYKHGAERVCLTFPGGRLEPHEDISDTAKRELLEETGYQASNWHQLGEFPIHANQHVGVVSIFRAESAERVAHPESGDLEDMEVVLVSPSEAKERLASGEIALLGDVAALSLTALID